MFKDKQLGIALKTFISKYFLLSNPYSISHFYKLDSLAKQKLLISTKIYITWLSIFISIYLLLCLCRKNFKFFLLMTKYELTTDFVYLNSDYFFFTISREGERESKKLIFSSLFVNYVFI